MKFKKILTKTIICSSLFIITAVPVFASTHGWEFTMKLREVNGDDNGMRYSVSKGSMTNTGVLTVTSLDKGAADSPYPVYAYVYKKSGLIHTNLGHTTVIPSRSGKSFSKSYGIRDAGTYYLKFAKTNDDGWNIKGSGRLETR
jgi:hypothetical protein